MGATLFGAASVRAPESSSRRRPENLALVFQEILTAIVRVRASRQAVNDAQVFRSHMQVALKNSEKQAIGKGYLPEDVRLATFAIVAFLDESVLNSSIPAFADWARMPLQEEMFGHHVAGETFFENLERLLARTDSHDLADLLEVYLLCLLLGYKGRYALAGQEAVRPVADSVAAKIRRARGPLPGLSPAWAVPEGPVAASQPDPWIRRLFLTAAACLLLALLLFVGFKLLLSSGASDLREIAVQGRT